MHIDSIWENYSLSLVAAAEWCSSTRARPHHSSQSPSPRTNRRCSMLGASTTLLRSISVFNSSYADSFTQLQASATKPFAQTPCTTHSNRPLASSFASNVPQATASPPRVEWHEVVETASGDPPCPKRFLRGEEDLNLRPPGSEKELGSRAACLQSLNRVLQPSRSSYHPGSQCKSLMKVPNRRM